MVFLIYLFKLDFFLLLFSLLMPVIIMLAPPLSHECKGAVFSFLHTRERIRLTWPDFCFTSERWCHLFQLTHFFLLFILFFQVIHFIFCFVLARGHWHRKKIYRVDFFAKASSAGLTNYIIRHKTKKGNMTSLFWVLGWNAISFVPVHWQGLQYDTNNV